IEMLCGPDGELPEKLRNLEPRLIEHVSNEIMDRDPNVRWNDIAGLEHAKKCVTEMVIWPLLRPDIFRGCRSPGRGLLLFGPPVGICLFFLYCGPFFSMLNVCAIFKGDRQNHDWKSNSW
ncbi:hypothetical protein U9M48_036112, partial [Paspalum notatum var. saurae]